MMKEKINLKKLKENKERDRHINEFTWFSLWSTSVDWRSKNYILCLFFIVLQYQKKNHIYRKVWINKYNNQIVTDQKN